MFTDEYFKALKKLRDHNKLVEDTLSVFKSDKKPVFTPPADLEYSKAKPTGRFKKAGRVHAVREQESTDEKLMFPEADESLGWTLPPDDRAASEQEDEDIEEEEELDQGREEEEVHPSAPIEFDRSVQKLGLRGYSTRRIGPQSASSSLTMAAATDYREEWSLRVLA